MRTHARVVVIGGGIAGVSVLYHLAQAGCADTLLLERNELTSGSTWHAAGHVPSCAAGYALMRAGNYAWRLYRGLAGAADAPIDYHVTGAIWPAQTAERVRHFRHLTGIAKTLDLDLGMLSVEEMRGLHPYLESRGLLAGLHDPYEGDIDPSQATQALASGARRRGTEIIRFTPVTGITRTATGEWEVHTGQGNVRCEIVVNAAGYRGGEIGAMVGQSLPLVTLEHQYLVTEDVPDLRVRAEKLVLLRDPDDCFYLRQERTGLLLGAYGHPGKPAWPDGIPEEFAMGLLPDALDDVGHVIERAIARVPLLGTAGVKRVVNGPIAYAPDAQPLVGPAEGLPGFYHCCGLQVGITHGPAAGKMIAEYITGGETEWDPFAWDPRRFGAWAHGRYAMERACELYEHQYAIPYPHRIWKSARPVCRTPLYELLAARGAVFGQVGGWERAFWFERAGIRDDEALSFGHEVWHGAVRAECEATRGAVAVMDHGGFARCEVRGPGAAAFLDGMSCTPLPAVGRVRLAYFLTERGMILSEATIARLGEQHFMLCGPTLTDRRDYDHLWRRLPADGSVRLDSGSKYDGALLLAGPRSRALLARVIDGDVSGEAMPWMSVREMAVGEIPVRVLRVSYTGELGFELHLPSVGLPEVYRRLRVHGAGLGLTDFGSYALNAMRIEKGFHGWGTEIGPEYTLGDAGLGRFGRPGKGEFIGRAALLAQRDRPAWRFVGLRVDSPDADSPPGSPITRGERPVGYVTSATTAFRCGGCVALGYVRAQAPDAGPFAVEVLGEPRPATFAALPFYDPGHERLRA